MNRLHLCCGDIYLQGYTNIDIKGIIWKGKPEENPNLTTIYDYYKDRKIGERREILVDKNMNLTTKWEIIDNSIDEILIICAIEHFTLQEAQFIINECKRVLKSGGKLIIDFPDVAKTVRNYIKIDPEYCMRLLYCSYKDIYSIHKWGYTFNYFLELLGDGWDKIKRKNVIKHDYPMIGVIAIKK